MPLPPLSPVPKRNEAKPIPVRGLAAVALGPCVKSGPKLKVAWEELKVFKMKSIPMKPIENVWAPWILVTSTDRVRASRGVAFKPPEPKGFTPLILMAGKAPGPPKLSRTVGRPSVDGLKGTPCGFRPSSQRPQPKLVSIARVGLMAKV